MFEEESRAKYALYLSFFLTLFGYAGRYFALEPVNNQFFPFAAWSFVLLADNLAWRFKDGSPLVSRTEEFLVLAAWSAAFGALAELLNLRLGAWDYTGMCSTLSTRWTGRLFSWAAALPSVFVLAELLEALRLFRGIRSRPFRLPSAAPALAASSGALLLAAALTFPSDCWPLAVAAPFLLAEPLLLKLGLPSLLRELSGGLPAKTLRLAASGLLCGLLWNWWDNAAGASWAYRAPPWLSPAPWLLYAGFPFLALSLYSLYSLASWLRGGRTWEESSWTAPGRRPHPALKWAAAAALPVLCYAALRAVDAHTVSLFLGWI